MYFPNMSEYYSFEPGKLINPFPHPLGHRINRLSPESLLTHSLNGLPVCYSTVPRCQKWPKEFISDFTNETEYYSLQTVLGSGSSFKPFPHPEGQCMNSLYAIRWCHYARIGPNTSFLILHMRVNITACRLF